MEISIQASKRIFFQSVSNTILDLGVFANIVANFQRRTFVEDVCNWFAIEIWIIYFLLLKATVISDIWLTLYCFNQYHGIVKCNLDIHFNLIRKKTKTSCFALCRDKTGRRKFKFLQLCDQGQRRWKKKKVTIWTLWNYSMIKISFYIKEIAWTQIEPLLANFLLCKPFRCSWNVWWNFHPLYNSLL